MTIRTKVAGLIMATSLSLCRTRSAVPEDGRAERHTVVYGFVTLKLFWQRCPWGALISPSAAFCFAVVISSIIWPLYGLAAVAFLAMAKRWLCVIVMAVALLLFPLVTDILIWGSFPFTYDNAGVAQLRMIPFIPWPSGDYGEF
jgi:hypothetical protein